MTMDTRSPYRQTLDALEKMMDPTDTVNFWAGLRKEKHMAKICQGCGAIGATCCETATERLKTANTLSGIVDRQSKEITRLTQLLGEKEQVITDLKVKMIVVPKAGS